VRKGDDLTTFMCRVSRNSGALTYQKPTRPVVGVLYFFILYVYIMYNIIDKYNINLLYVLYIYI